MVAVTARWLTLSIKYGRLIPVEEGDPRFLPPHILRASSDEARALVPEGYADRGGGRYVRLPCSPDNTLGIHSKVRAAILPRNSSELWMLSELTLTLPSSCC